MYVLCDRAELKETALEGLAALETDKYRREKIQ